MGNDKQFIRNTLDTNVDGIKRTIRYTVKAMYDKEYKDERGSYWKVEHDTLEDFELAWKEVEQRGGNGTVIKELREKYNIEKS